MDRLICLLFMFVYSIMAIFVWSLMHFYIGYDVFGTLITICFLLMAGKFFFRLNLRVFNG